MLRNRQDKETDKLKGVYRASVDDLPNVTQQDLGRFRHLENWIPGKLWSIKKKRGPDITPPGAEFVQGTCGVCPANTIPDVPQMLVQSNSWTSAEFQDLTGLVNARATWAHVGPGPEIYVMIHQAGGVGLVDPCDTTLFKLVHILGDTMEVVPTPAGHCGAIAGSSPLIYPGFSDEHSYGMVINVGGVGFGSGIGYFSVAQGIRVLCGYSGEDSGTHSMNGFSKWAKKGTDLYVTISNENYTAPYKNLILRYNPNQAGLQLENTVGRALQTVTPSTALHISLTDDFLYIVTGSKIEKIARTNLNVVSATISPGLGVLTGAYPVDDSILYLTTDDKIYYYTAASGAVEVAEVTGAWPEQWTGFASTAIYMRDGCIYTGSSGIVGTDATIFEVCGIECPGTGDPIPF